MASPGDGATRARRPRHQPVGDHDVALVVGLATGDDASCGARAELAGRDADGRQLQEARGPGVSDARHRERPGYVDARGAETREDADRSLVVGADHGVRQAIPGQEERNADHLLEQGAAIRCNNLPTMSYKLDRLLSDGERFKAMQANCRFLRITGSGLRESHVHDVAITKEAPNYRSE